MTLVNTNVKGLVLNTEDLTYIDGVETAAVVALLVSNPHASAMCTMRSLNCDKYMAWEIEHAKQLLSVQAEAVIIDGSVVLDIEEQYRVLSAYRTDIPGVIEVTYETTEYDYDYDVDIEVYACDDRECSRAVITDEYCTESVVEHTELFYDVS